MAFSRLLLKSLLPRISSNSCQQKTSSPYRLISTSASHHSSSSDFPHKRKLSDDPAAFKPKRAVLVSKMSRFEFEKRRYSDHSEDGEEISEKRLRKVVSVGLELDVYLENKA